MAKARSGSNRRKAPDHTIRGDIGGGPGASDSYSGGGNATGIPDADTAMRLGRAPGGGDVKEDRAKLFPERFARAKAGGSKKAGGAKSGGAKTSGAKAGGAKAKAAGAKARSGRPLKKHGDKFEDKIPSNTRGRAKASAGGKKKAR